jgi:hypothetical protein
MYCHHCHAKLEDEPEVLLVAPGIAASTKVAPMKANCAGPRSRKDSLTRMSVIACSLLLLLLALAFFALSVQASNAHQALLVGLGALLLAACEVVWTARSRKAIIGSFVIAGAGVAVVGLLVAFIGAGW